MHAAAKARAFLPRTLPENLRRFPLRNERGDTLVEVIVAMAMLFTLVVGFSGAHMKANAVMKTSVNETVADEASAAFIEKARAAEWSSVGIAGVPVPAPGTAGPASGSQVTGGSIPAVTTVTVRGLDVTLTTNVTWQSAPVGGGAYGTKAIALTVTWQDHKGNPLTVRTVQQKAVLTPGLDQAAPSGIRGGS